MKKRKLIRSQDPPVRSRGDERPSRRLLIKASTAKESIIDAASCRSQSLRTLFYLDIIIFHSLKLTAE